MTVRIANRPAITLRALRAAWAEDATSHAVDALTADLVSHAAAAGHPLCIGMIRGTHVPALHNLQLHLHQCGVLLRTRKKPECDAAYMFLEVAPTPPAEFEGHVRQVRANAEVPA